VPLAALGREVTGIPSSGHDPRDLPESLTRNSRCSIVGQWLTMAAAHRP